MKSRRRMRTASWPQEVEYHTFTVQEVRGDTCGCPNRRGIAARPPPARPGDCGRARRRRQVPDRRGRACRRMTGNRSDWGALSMPRYSVRSGDCIHSLAAEHELDWQTIWDHPANAALRARRASPGILSPGDEVEIPAEGLGNDASATGALQRRRILTSAVAVRLRFLDPGGRPRAGLRYRLVVDGRLRQGVTNAEGELAAPVRPRSRVGLLELLDRGRVERYIVDLGMLDPIDSPSGLQQRLRNLGYACALSGRTDEQTRAAVRRFQANQPGLLPDGEPGRDTLDRLAAVHGS